MVFSVLKSILYFKIPEVSLLTKYLERPFSVSFPAKPDAKVKAGTADCLLPGETRDFGKCVIDFKKSTVTYC
jgi:hypothetical protein